MDGRGAGPVHCRVSGPLRVLLLWVVSAGA